jgi:hypothetical protein
MLRYANSITVLQYTSSSSITTTTILIILIMDYIRQNVFVHMQRHANEEKEKKGKNDRVDLSSVLHVHTK